MQLHCLMSPPCAMLSQVLAVFLAMRKDPRLKFHL